MTIHYNEVHDEKIIYFVIISTLLLFGCSTIDHHLNKNHNQCLKKCQLVNIGQGFQPKAEKALLNMRRNIEKNMKTRRTIL